MSEMWIGISIVALGYLMGSLPFAIWITHMVKDVDVREAGSGHATTTNTIRQAGWAAGAAVLIFDIAKGYLPVLLALRYGAYPWVLPFTLAAVVAGHCWPLYAGFRGWYGVGGYRWWFDRHEFYTGHVRAGAADHIGLAD